MAHKVHPKSYRIKTITDWDSRGFYGKKFPEYLKKDFEIRGFLKNKLARIGVEKIEIERSSGKVNIIISTARPGLIIGRGGEGIEQLKKELEKILKEKKSFVSSAKNLPGKKFSENKEIRIEIREINDPWLSAALSAQYIAQQIEKRLPFRRVLKQALEKIINHKEVKGARVEIAGRLNGAEIARTEWFKKGRLPRQTIRADIDYAQATAHCTYGAVGVKVWIYKGEKF